MVVVAIEQPPRNPQTAVMQSRLFGWTFRLFNCSAVFDSHWRPNRKSSCRLPNLTESTHMDQVSQSSTFQKNKQFIISWKSQSITQVFAQFLFMINILLYDSEYCSSFRSHYISRWWIPQPIVIERLFSLVLSRWWITQPIVIERLFSLVVCFFVVNQKGHKVQTDCLLNDQNTTSWGFDL